MEAVDHPGESHNAPALSYPSRLADQANGSIDETTANPRAKIAWPVSNHAIDACFRASMVGPLVTTGDETVH
jgi:hypothetical protein